MQLQKFEARLVRRPWAHFASWVSRYTRAVVAYGFATRKLSKMARARALSGRALTWRSWGSPPVRDGSLRDASPKKDVRLRNDGDRVDADAPRTGDEVCARIYEVDEGGKVARGEAGCTTNLDGLMAGRCNPDCSEAKAYVSLSSCRPQADERSSCA
eukprot:scaffold100712_cov31-Tisochrysis_lutea.AAC.3